MQAFGRLLLELSAKSVALHVTSQPRIDERNARRASKDDDPDKDHARPPTSAPPKRKHFR